jgi:urea carboxylase
MFNKVLIANRGEIACRIIRTLERLGIASVVVFSEPDAHTQAVLMATEAVCVGPVGLQASYLNGERILKIAKQTGAEAIHPGYGFLSENAAFAEACARENIAFIGPTPTQLRQFGLKHTSRELAQANQIPLIPGTSLLESLTAATSAAAALHYPIMLKSTAGGGGIGLQVCQSEAELSAAFEQVQRLSQTNFNQRGVFLEKYIQTARHIEVQIFGDGQGNVVALGERDCSIQRRNQKVIEETPAPGISDRLRQDLWAAALRLGKAVHYQSAGTVEFVFDVETQQFYFLEVNTRLQVEHGITEAIYGVDLVEWMVKLASGDLFALTEFQPQPQGHAIQARIYAEDPGKNFQPSAGTLHQVIFPAEVRCDRWIEAGSEITPYYDPLLAKLIVHGRDRAGAIADLKSALKNSRIDGIETNLDYLQQILDDPRFSGEFGQPGLNTRFLNTFHYAPRTIDVLVAGTYSTIQDYPGRIGYWDVGVPPSGPMDPLAFRWANRLLGNPESAAGLEFTVTGPTLRFNADTVIALTGAAMQASLNSQPVPFWTAIAVKVGSTLKLNAMEGAGQRTYLAVKGGLDCPDYLGSKSTFVLGKFGGHAGRTLRPGDVLKLNQTAERSQPQALPVELIPTYTHQWQIGVLYGPHGAPDFFTPEDIQTFLATDWKIHYNSTRTGIRLIGPKPKWARPDGGEAGLHPSNIHDNAYAIGSIDFTGDMPVILGLDGPSLGGFVCPFVIAQAERWKMGQLKPGDTVRFYPINFQQALALELAQDQQIANLEPIPLPEHDSAAIGSPILHRIPEEHGIAIIYRQAGDKYILVEYGPLVLDLNLRFCAHALKQWLLDNHIPGIVDLTPGMRSLQIHYDSRVVSQSALLDALVTAENELPSIVDIQVPTRIVHLPLSWDDEATQLAIQKYIQSVRADAPWCPSNLEFIRRINGLDSIQKVKEIVFNASYWVMGLGDVYLGAPVATPLDPRHRLVTTKYNPARTWTPENAVGIGGAYLCVYGMEGPGGYQFVGRTVQMWNRFKQTADFQQPWLLRCFDQIRFYPVSGPELLRLREAFLEGKFKLEIEEATFSLKQYNQFLEANASAITAFKTQQQAAFEAERDRWAMAGEFEAEAEAEAALEIGEADCPEIILPPGSEAVLAHLSANVWQVLVKPGDQVEAGDRLLILEAMKMEIEITTEIRGVISAVFCQKGQTVIAGQILIGIGPN